MQKHLLFTTLCLLFILPMQGQDREKYGQLIEAAWQLYESKAYAASGEKYTEAFVAMKGKGTVTDRYNAACAWALANQPDSAFVQLNKIANNGGYTNYGHLTTDADLNSLHNDHRWLAIVALVKANKEKAEAKLDKFLVAQLDTIYQEDQKYRQQIAEIEAKYGWDSEEMTAHWKIIHFHDSINLIQITQLLDERGWLGPDIIGNQGNATLFLVIQHADFETQEKYLPMMQEAVKHGNARASSLALLEDRVALRKGNKQIYGSQIGRDPETGEYYVLPLIDPDHVDRRRAEMGLGSLQSYISNWNMTWDVEVYKQKLPEYVAKQEQ